MALLFHPAPGDIVVCDFHGSVGAEMTKRRPVVVISPNFKSRTGLCCVVPLGTTAPEPVAAYHYLLTLKPTLPVPFDSPEMWVKGDMLATVSFQRLDLLRTERRRLGKREYAKCRVSGDALPEIYRSVLNGLGLGRLTPHL